jgi:hypothetical protein
MRTIANAVSHVVGYYNHPTLGSCTQPCSTSSVTLKITAIQVFACAHLVAQGLRGVLGADQANETTKSP